MYLNENDPNSPIRPINHKTKEIRDKILKKAAQDTLIKKNSNTYTQDFNENNQSIQNLNENQRKRSSGTFHTQGDNKFRITSNKFSKLQGSPPRKLMSEKPVYISKKIDPIKTIKIKEQMKRQKEMENISEATPKSEFYQSGFKKSKDLEESSQGKILNPQEVEQLKKETKFRDELSNTDKDFFKKGTFQEDWEKRQQNKDNLFLEAKIYGQIPIVNPDGSIPKEKIVGKPEWFIKQHLNSMYNDKQHQFQKSVQASSVNSQQNLNTINSNLDDTLSIKSNQQTLNLNSFRNQRSFTFAHRNQNVLKHKLNQKAANELKLDKDQVAREIHDVIIRLTNNKKMDQTMHDMMTSNQNYSVEAQIHDKDQRSFQNYNQQQGIWKHIIKKNTQKVKRNFENSILFASDTYRSKVETVKALDSLIPDSERFGNRYWEKTLRTNEKVKNLKEIQEEQDKSQQFPNQFSKVIDYSEKNKPDLEIIRKPKSNILKGKYEGISNFTTFKSDKYFRQKFQNCSPEKIEQIQHLDDREYDNLEVQGQSKLQMEITNLLEDENVKYFKKINIKEQEKEKQDQNQNQNDIEEEVICINYDKNHLTQMPGYSFQKYNIKY